MCCSVSACYVLLLQVTTWAAGPSVSFMNITPHLISRCARPWVLPLLLFNKWAHTREMREDLSGGIIVNTDFSRCVWEPRPRISSTRWKLKASLMMEKVPKCRWLSWNRQSCRRWVNLIAEHFMRYLRCSIAEPKKICILINMYNSYYKSYKL